MCLLQISPNVSASAYAHVAGVLPCYAYVMLMHRAKTLWSCELGGGGSVNTAITPPPQKKKKKKIEKKSWANTAISQKHIFKYIIAEYRRISIGRVQPRCHTENDTLLVKFKANNSKISYVQFSI